MDEGFDMPGEWIEERWQSYVDNYLESSELSEQQLEEMARVDEANALREVSTATRTMYLSKAKKFGKFIDKPFSEATREDIEAFLKQEAKDLKPATVRVSKSVLRQFYALLEDPAGREIPDKVSWIKFRTSMTNKTLPDDLLTPEEIKELASRAWNTRDRAIIMTLYESAARVSELCGLQMKDVDFDQYGGRIYVSGKTGPRKIRLINSVKDLQQWLEYHPWTDDPEAPVFIRLGIDDHPEPLLQDGITDAIDRAVRASDINKNVYPHLFRHSRLTELAKDLSESELKVFAGWTADSDMAKVYIHLSGDDVDKKILRKAGLLEDEEDDEEDLLEMQVCPKCSEENSAVAAYCTNCNLPLDEETRTELLQEDQDLKESLPTVLKVLEDPEVARVVAKRVNELEPPATSERT